MNIKTKIGFHNKFNIRVIRAGEVIQNGYAENIVLDRAYTRLCAFNTYFVRIVFGSGTGEPEPVRTSLFNTLGNKVAELTERVYAYPTSSVTKRIVLLPSEYVGNTITEVGISETTTNINTHAMIKDAEGNPISITKTGLDIVEIYATVYITLLENTTQKISFLGSPETNRLLRYFLEDTAPLNTIETSNCLLPGEVVLPNTVQSKTATRTADAPNKKVRWGPLRFETSESNTAITHLAITGMVDTRVPSEVFSGLAKENVKLGVGDGMTSEFLIPDVMPRNINVKKDDSVVSDYTLVEHMHHPWTLTKTRLHTSSTNVPSINLLPNNNVLVIDNSTPYAGHIYSYDEDVQGYILRTTSESSAFFNNISFSKNGLYFMSNSNGNTYNFTFDPVTNRFEKRDITTRIGTDNLTRLVAISDDGQSLLVFSYSSGIFLVRLYTLDTANNEWVLNITLPASSPVAWGMFINGSADKILYQANSSTAIVYERSDDTYVEKKRISGLAANYTMRPIFGGPGEDDHLLLFDTNTSTVEHRVYKYDSANDDLILIRTFPKPVTNANSPRISNDLLRVTTVVGNDIYLQSYDVETDTVETQLIPLTTAPHSPISVGNALAVTDELLMCSGTETGLGGYVALVSLKKYWEKVIFDTPPASGVVIGADYEVDYIPKDEDHVLDVTFEIQFGEGV